MATAQENDDALLAQINEAFNDLDEYGASAEQMVDATDDKFMRSLIEKIKDAIIAYANASLTGDAEDESEMLQALLGHMRSYADRDAERREKFAALLLSSGFWQRAKALKRNSGSGNGSSSHKPIGEIFESRNARDGR